MVDLVGWRGAIHMNQGKSGAGDFVFARGPESRDDAFGERGLAGPKISSQKHQHRGLEPFREFPAPLGCLFAEWVMTSSLTRLQLLKKLVTRVGHGGGNFRGKQTRLVSMLRGKLGSFAV